MFVETSYTFIFQIETDGDILIEYMTYSEFEKRYIEKYSLSEYDFAIIEGRVIKYFNDRLHERFLM